MPQNFYKSTTNILLSHCLCSHIFACYILHSITVAQAPDGSEILLRFPLFLLLLCLSCLLSAPLLSVAVDVAAKSAKAALKKIFLSLLFQGQ